MIHKTGFMNHVYAFLFPFSSSYRHVSISHDLWIKIVFHWSSTRFLIYEFEIKLNTINTTASRQHLELRKLRLFRLTLTAPRDYRTVVSRHQCLALYFLQQRERKRRYHETFYSRIRNLHARVGKKNVFATLRFQHVRMHGRQMSYLLVFVMKRRETGGWKYDVHYLQYCHLFLFFNFYSVNVRST